MRPLDPLRSIKVKLGVLVGVSLVASTSVLWYSQQTGIFLRYSMPIAIVVALSVTYLLAHGMTSPLREMTAAVRAMARGDYTRRVRATSRDEVGELGRAFNHMAADLAAADRQRRELIANVSHELRTPISALQAVLENVVDGVSDPSELRAALGQTERLGRLVAELLDLSRLDAGVVPLHRESFAVRDFLDEAVALVDGPVTVEVAPVDLTVHADRERLHQVVANLVDNARRHGPPGGRVAVGAYRTLSTTVIEVADDGPGIPPEERERVFERFTRGGRRAGDAGTGLGLAIAQWAVQLHGGVIGVADDHRPGCRIRVELPA